MELEKEVELGIGILGRRHERADEGNRGNHQASEQSCRCHKSRATLLNFWGRLKDGVGKMSVRCGPCLPLPVGTPKSNLLLFLLVAMARFDSNGSPPRGDVE